MKRVGPILCFLYALCGYGQNAKIDSLKATLPTTTSESRVLVLHELVKSLWTTDPNTAIKYGREAIALAIELEDLKLQSISYRLFGGLYNYMSIIDSGRYYKSKALKIALELNDSTLLAPTYNNIGVSSQTVGNYVEALEYYYRSYLIGKSLPGFKGVPIIFSNISEVYCDLKVYDSAILYAQKAIAKTESAPNTSGHLLAKISLARAYLAKGYHERADTIYQSIIEIGKNIGDRRYTAYAFQGLGRSHIKTGNHKQARLLFIKALKLFRELDDEAYIAEIFLDFGTLYMSEAIDSSFYYTRKSLVLARKLSLNDIAILNYKNQCRLARLDT